MYYIRKGKGCWRGVWQFSQLLTATWHRQPLHQKALNEQCLHPAQWWWLWTPDNTAVSEVLLDCECHNFVYKWNGTVQKPHSRLMEGFIYLPMPLSSLRILDFTHIKLLSYTSSGLPSAGRQCSWLVLQCQPWCTEWKLNSSHAPGLVVNTFKGIKILKPTIRGCRWNMMG
jgi:hypothetical protein